MIQFFQINRNDGFPEKICPKCIALIIEMLAFKRRCETLDQLLHSTRMDDVNPSESQDKNNVLVEFDDDLTTDPQDDRNFETSSPLKLAKELPPLKPPSDNSLLPKPSEIGVKNQENPEIEKPVADVKTVKGHICDICGRGFSRPSYLVKHMAAHKDGFQCNTGIKTHVCDYCQKSFLRLNCLKQHMSVCSLLRTYGGKNVFITNLNIRSGSAMSEP